MKGPLFLSARHRHARDRVAAALAAIDADRDRRQPDDAAYGALGDALDNLQQQNEEGDN